MIAHYLVILSVCLSIDMYMLELTVNIVECRLIPRIFQDLLRLRAGLDCKTE